MSARHPASEPGVLDPVAGAFTIPPTQTDVAYQGNHAYDTFPSQEIASGTNPGDVLSWNVPPVLDAMTDLAESYIVFNGYYTLDTDLFLNTSLSTPPFLAAFLVNDLSMEMNGTTVVPSQGVGTPYAHIASILKNYPATEKQSNTFTQALLLDDFNQTGAWGTFGTGPQNVRCGYYLASSAANAPQRPFSLTFKLTDAGLRSKGGWVPPNTSMRIRCRRSPTAQLRIGSATDITTYNPTYTLNSATLYVSRKVLSPSAKMRIASAWPSAPMRLPFERTRTAISWYPASITDVSVVSQLAGPTPSAVWAFIVPQAAINGTSNGTISAAEMRPHGLSHFTNATLSIGGSRTYPIQPLNTIYAQGGVGGSFLNNNLGTLDFSQMYEMYRASAHTACPFLSDTDFSNIAPLCFQIGTRSDGGWDLGEEVSIQFAANLNVNQPNPFALVLISFTDTMISFSAQGQVQLL